MLIKPITAPTNPNASIKTTPTITEIMSDITLVKTTSRYKGVYRSIDAELYAKLSNQCPKHIAIRKL